MFIVLRYVFLRERGGSSLITRPIPRDNSIELKCCVQRVKTNPGNPSIASTKDAAHMYPVIEYHGDRARPRTNLSLIDVSAYSLQSEADLLRDLITPANAKLATSRQATHEHAGERS